MTKKTNLYDNVYYNIECKHNEFERDKNHRLKRRNLQLTKTLIKYRMWDKLSESGFIRDWFDEFNMYWTKYLGFRPLRLHDFFWLESIIEASFNQLK